MEAIFEHGGLNNTNNSTDALYDLNYILDAIYIADYSNELLGLLDRIKHRAEHKWHRKFIYEYGVTSEGIEIYQEGIKDRLIFIPCETDTEI